MSRKRYFPEMIPHLPTQAAFGKVRKHFLFLFELVGALSQFKKAAKNNGWGGRGEGGKKYQTLL